jgi:hypothetical protein
MRPEIALVPVLQWLFEFLNSENGPKNRVRVISPRFLPRACVAQALLR